MSAAARSSSCSDEWVSGASAAYAKNDKYVPRQEPPSYFAGGKVVNFDRVEWKIMPDPATASAALQRGEVDWWENPLFDLLPLLKKSPGIKIEVLDPLGALGVIAVNHTQPPFDNPKLLQAMLPAINQQDYMDAVLGEQQELGRTGVVLSFRGSPLASDVDMDKITGKRDLALAKKLVAESGYNGEPIVLMSPSDQPQLDGDGAGDRRVLQIARPELAIHQHGLGHAGHAARQPRTVEQGRLEQLLHHLGRADQCPTPAATFRCAATAMAAGSAGRPTRQDGGAARQMVRRAGHAGAEGGLQGHAARWRSRICRSFRPGSGSSRPAHRDDLTGFVKAGCMLFWGVKRV